MAAGCLGARAGVQAHDGGQWWGAGVWWAGLWSCQQAGLCDWGSGPAGSQQKAGGLQWWLWPWLRRVWLLWWPP